MELETTKADDDIIEWARANGAEHIYDTPHGIRVDFGDKPGQIIRLGNLPECQDINLSDYPTLTVDFYR